MPRLFKKLSGRLSLAILLIGATGSTGFSQKSIVIGALNQGPPKNLTQLLESKCNQAIKKRVGDSATFEIRHDRRSSELANKIAIRLESSVQRVVEIIDRKVEAKILIYVARVDSVPSSYEVIAPGTIDFVYPIVYDSSTSLDINCDGITKLCETIYTTIPHELTHHLLDGKLSEDATWLGEGLAEYVSDQVGSEFSPRQAFKRKVETLPEVSLNSAEIREGLLTWTYTPETLKAESLLTYGAAHQLIRLIVAESERAKVRDPLVKLIALIKNRKETLSSAEALELIKTDLKVDVTNLGKLEDARKVEIFKNAVETFWIERNVKRTAYKYNSLVTFAYMDNPITDSLLVALVEEVFNDKNSDLFKRLSVKALIPRLDQSSFDRTQIKTRLKRYGTEKILSSQALKEHLIKRCRD
jgi:uncharacterized protein (UPF0147 family)